MFAYVDLLRGRARITMSSARLRCAPEPSGVDGLLLKSLCPMSETPTEKLSDELDHWVDLMSNGSPDYTAYRALNAARMLAADKKAWGETPSI